MLSGQSKLEGVHPDLVKVVRKAAEMLAMDITVLEGTRTLDRQKKLLAAGASTTLKSRHLSGHAVDLGAIVEGAVRWDWPLYFKIAAAVKAAARDLGIEIEWGGDWKTFKDGPHFQLPWKAYPVDPTKS